ncbi:hypothetical protein CHS0354_016558 [Potamilus streckersoni]|uniref:V-type proton ATPase subunit a n=1 Tax=Potamilus streckersoni TaxID=2493646 RepID=A0AAE0TN64_9BIVA|nr:hypothetical protein CHS0354_016558 [Potamilus streckersoni]
MGSLLRSEEMTLCQLFLQSEAAYACVSELGELGLVQFRDLNPNVNAFQRKFVNEVRRCDEMERKLRFLEKEIKKDGIPMLDTGDNPDAPVPREMIDLEATFEKLESEMKEVNANSEALKRNFLELTELKHILRKTQTFFDEAIHDPTLTDEAVGLLGEEIQRAGQALKLGFVAGVILREKIPAFERMLWRVCRGNVFLRQAEIETPLEDPITGDQVRKTVFIIFFQGDQLKSRVKKICEGFRATLYPCPETPSDRREMAIGVMTRIEDLNTVLGQTQDHRHRVLVAAAKNIKVWFIKVHKIKAIYHTLNMFNLDVTQKCLIAECWCPVTDLDRIQQALRRGNERSGSSVPSILNRMHTKEEPPTYNRTNKFTEVFQSMVDSYGVATYREINPAPYTIISFPFLFAMMFGDTGHGTIMFLFALYMVIREKALQARKIENEIWDIFFNGRYIILLMGAFSIYTGLIYNDIFSRGVNIFGSSWNPNNKTYSEHVLEGWTTIKVEPNETCFKGPYPLGLDPIWQHSENKITVTNSFKMKVSVIFGVTQMLFGVALSLLNHRYFRKPLNIFCEFIPQLIFMCSIFGYLIILIFVKWTHFTSKDSSSAPNLLIGLINMFLMTYPENDKNPSVHTFYPGQKGFQIFLVVLAVLCVPWMLLVKPLLLRHWIRHGQQRHAGTYYLLNGEVPEVVHHSDNDTEEEDEEEPFDFGETLIHQGIHTIEYCLGCISHTASYLRLWALSLAHAQLSEVLWGMVMSTVLRMDGLYGAFLLVPVFTVWAFLTLIILVVMEGLSAFLHALRLHWVEFQSKFYTGQGYKFMPFSFDNLMDYSLEEK